MDHIIRKIQGLSFSDKIVFFILLIVTFLVHAPALFPSDLVNPDSKLIFATLFDVHNPNSYFQKLVNYETLDFQPVRDLSLLIDLFLFKKTGWISFAFVSSIVWAAVCFIIYKIFCELFFSRSTNLFLILAFAVYPIFGQTVNWGIARKHLLAFFFICWATYRLLVWIRTSKGDFLICILYACSVLSLPVSLLWPVWATIAVRYLWPEKLSAFRKTAIVLFSIMLLTTFINWSYYKTSAVFLENYPPKEGRLDFVLMFISLGHYVKQLLYPYQLAFTYTYDGGAIVGIVVFCLFGLWVIAFHRKNRAALIWLLYSFVHLAVLLSSPAFYYDPYVLSPALGLLLFILMINSHRSPKYLPLLFIPVLIWGALTFRASANWTNESAFARESYEHDPNCSSALSYAIDFYTEEKKAPDSLFSFIQENQCLEMKPNTPRSRIIDLLSFEALQLYVEDDIDMDYRIRRLHELGKQNYNPMLFNIAFLVKLDRKEEVEEAAAHLNRVLPPDHPKIEYHPIYSEVIPPYCRKNELTECNKLIKRFSFTKTREL